MEHNNNYQYSDAVVQIFTRTPVSGKCKSRLAKDTSDLFAAQIQAVMLDILVKRITLSNLCSLQLWFHGETEYFDRYSEFACYQQTGSTLGERMNAGLECGLHTYNKVIIVGSDCISHTAEVIEDALRKLDHYSTVIAPAYDGGYTLLGSRKSGLPIFNDINWGNKTVYEQTLQQLTTHQISCFALPVQHDVDEGVDLEYVHI